MRGVLAGLIQFVRAFCEGGQKKSCHGAPRLVGRSFERVLDLDSTVLAEVNRPRSRRFSDFRRQTAEMDGD